MDVAGRDGLDTEVLGEVAQEGEPARVSALERPLELDEEALAAERRREPCSGVRVEEAEPATRASGEADEPLVQLADGLERDGRRQRLAVLRPARRVPACAAVSRRQRLRVPVGATPRAASRARRRRA